MDRLHILTIVYVFLTYGVFLFWSMELLVNKKRMVQRLYNYFLQYIINQLRYIFWFRFFFKSTTIYIIHMFIPRPFRRIQSKIRSTPASIMRTTLVFFFLIQLACVIYKSRGELCYRDHLNMLKVLNVHFLHKI